MPSLCLRLGDHLRVCGADDGLTLEGVAVPGSSPRVRSGLRPQSLEEPDDGIISACAERTGSPTAP